MNREAIISMMARMVQTMDDDQLAKWLEKGAEIQKRKEQRDVRTVR